MSQTLEESKDNETNKIPYDLIPDNTYTAILKVNGKIYAQGADIGKIEADMHDEDLDSTLRAINGLGVSVQRTLAVAVAGRDATYKVPGDNPTIEEDLTPKVEEEVVGSLYIAAGPIRQGQAVHILPDGKVVGLEAEPTKETPEV